MKLERMVVVVAGDMRVSEFEVISESERELEWQVESGNVPVELSGEHLAADDPAGAGNRHSVSH